MLALRPQTAHLLLLRRQSTHFLLQLLNPLLVFSEAALLLFVFGPPDFLTQLSELLVKSNLAANEVLVLLLGAAETGLAACMQLSQRAHLLRLALQHVVQSLDLLPQHCKLPFVLANFHLPLLALLLELSGPALAGRQLAVARLEQPP